MKKIRIPDTMTVAVLNSYSGADALSIEQRPIPKPGRNEVLVKIAFSPINPSDLATLKGFYGFKDPTPNVPGGEGSGEVVSAGPGVMASYFLGKNVACAGWGTGGGVWSEYVVKSVKGGVMPLNKSLSLEQGAMSMKDAKELVLKSIKSAIRRDTMSGDGVDLLIVTKEGIQEENTNF